MEFPCQSGGVPQAEEVDSRQRGRLIELFRPVDERPMFGMGARGISPALTHRFKLAQGRIVIPGGEFRSAGGLCVLADQRREKQRIIRQPVAGGGYRLFIDAGNHPVGDKRKGQAITSKKIF